MTMRVHQGRAYDQERWNRWERTGAGLVAPMPGAREALQSIRNHGVTVIFNTNRLAANAAQTEALLNEARARPGGPRRDALAAGRRRHRLGQGPAPRGDRRALLRDRHGRRPARRLLRPVQRARLCAVPDRRRYATTPPFSALWGQGWFILSNPVYGSGLRGRIDEVFPADKRWTDPQGGNR